MNYNEYPTLPVLLKMAGMRRPQQTADMLLLKLESRAPAYTAVAVFKGGPLDAAIILPIGPACAIGTLEEAITATVQGKSLCGYWRKPCSPKR